MGSSEQLGERSLMKNTSDRRSAGEKVIFLEAPRSFRTCGNVNPLSPLWLSRAMVSVGITEGLSRLFHFRALLSPLVSFLSSLGGTDNLTLSTVCITDLQLRFRHASSRSGDTVAPTASRGSPVLGDKLLGLLSSAVVSKQDTSLGLAAMVQTAPASSVCLSVSLRLAAQARTSHP